MILLFEMARLKESCMLQNGSLRCTLGTLRSTRNKLIWILVLKIRWNSNSIWIQNAPLNNSIWTHPRLENEEGWFPLQRFLLVVFRRQNSFFRYLYFYSYFFSFSCYFNHFFSTRYCFKDFSQCFLASNKILLQMMNFQILHHKPIINLFFVNFIQSVPLTMYFQNDLLLKVDRLVLKDFK